MGGGFNCERNKIVSLKEGPSEVGRDFNCACNKLTRLDFIPKGIEGSFDCSDNMLTSIEELAEITGIDKILCKGNRGMKELPDRFKARYIVGDIYEWRGSTWSFFDGVESEVISKYRLGAFTVFKLRNDTCVVYDGEYYAQGDTVKKAKKDFIYKRATSNLSKFESYTLDTILSLTDCIELYSSVTGACTYGVKKFCKEHKELKKEYSVKEVIELTKGQYGNRRFEEFFKEEKQV